MRTSQATKNRAVRLSKAQKQFNNLKAIGAIRSLTYDEYCRYNSLAARIDRLQYLQEQARVRGELG